MKYKFIFILLLISVLSLNCGDSSNDNPFDDNTSNDIVYDNTPKVVETQNIPAGTFKMGNIWDSSVVDEIPIHNVTLSEFFMGKYEITNGEFIKFLRDIKVDSEGRYNNILVYDISQRDTSIIYSNGTFISRNGDNYPVTHVTWEGAVLYCNWLSEKFGLEKCYDENTFVCDFSKNGYRLPTEAEWEYAAGVDITASADENGIKPKHKYPWGDEDISKDKCNYDSDSTKIVGSYPSYNGLYDMAGNVAEWCYDKFGSYTSESVTNPTGYGNDIYRVVRGGYYAKPIPEDFMTTRRIGQWDQKSGFMGYGFRVARSK